MQGLRFETHFFSCRAEAFIVRYARIHWVCAYPLVALSCLQLQAINFKHYFEAILVYCSWQACRSVRILMKISTYSGEFSFTMVMKRFRGVRTPLFPTPTAPLHEISFPTITPAWVSHACKRNLRVFSERTDAKWTYFFLKKMVFFSSGFF